MKIFEKWIFLRIQLNRNFWYISSLVRKYVSVSLIVTKIVCLSAYYDKKQVHFYTLPLNQSGSSFYEIHYHLALTITSVLLRKSLSADNRTYYRTPFFWRNEDFSRIFLNFHGYSWIVMNTNFSMIIGVQRYLSKLQVWLGWVINRCGMDDLGIIIVNLKINVKNFENFHFQFFPKTITNCQKWIL